MSPDAAEKATLLASCLTPSQSAKNTGDGSEWAAGTACETTSESSNGTGHATDWTSAACETTGESSNGTGHTTDWTGAACETTGESSNSTGHTTDWTGAACETTGESSNSTGHATDWTGTACETTGESSNGTGHATDWAGPSGETTSESGDGAGDATDWAARTASNTTCKSGDGVKRPIALLLRSWLTLNNARDNGTAKQAALLPARQTSSYSADSTDGTSDWECAARSANNATGKITNRRGYGANWPEPGLGPAGNATGQAGHVQHQSASWVACRSSAGDATGKPSDCLGHITKWQGESALLSTTGCLILGLVGSTLASCNHGHLFSGNKMFFCGSISLAYLGNRSGRS
ncbi:hypothetical protein RJ55_00485 [Drechmeria coniospora]|nr:hypothetical protein RJ55_00485 [Drechmeria coniospora]